MKFKVFKSLSFIWMIVFVLTFSPLKAHSLRIASCQFPVSADIKAHAAWIMKQITEGHVEGAAITMEAPFSKLVCMGRAPMIPGFLGSNIEGVFKPEKRAQLYGHWESLPPAVKELGKYPE